MPRVFLVTCAQSITRYLNGKAQLFEDKPNAVYTAHALRVGGSAACKFKAYVVFAQGFAAPAVKNGVVIAHAGRKIEIAVRNYGIAALAKA